MYLTRGVFLLALAAGPIKPKEHLKKQRSPKPQTEEESAQEKRTRRDKELRERKMYLKNFWYAAGGYNGCRAGWFGML